MPKMWVVVTMLNLICCVLNLMSGEFRVALPWGMATLYSFVILVNEEAK